eukprot:GHVP01056721.1.p1 GENE.GHVP01056721.1~~GHVP01056721.1.p1  ORF type:complete len:335 (-),score=64.32 GHVP01056721.1:30-1034(-)
MPFCHYVLPGKKQLHLQFLIKSGTKNIISKTTLTDDYFSSEEFRNSETGVQNLIGDNENDSFEFLPCAFSGKISTDSWTQELKRGNLIVKNLSPHSKYTNSILKECLKSAKAPTSEPVIIMDLTDASLDLTNDPKDNRKGPKKPGWLKEWCNEKKDDLLKHVQTAASSSNFHINGIPRFPELMAFGFGEDVTVVKTLQRFKQKEKKGNSQFIVKLKGDDFLYVLDFPDNLRKTFESFSIYASKSLGRVPKDEEYSSIQKALFLAACICTVGFACASLFSAVGQDAPVKAPTKHRGESRHASRRASTKSRNASRKSGRHASPRESSVKGKKIKKS